MKQPFLFCYDIGNDKRRRKVAKILEKHGERIQYSVFFLIITQNVLSTIKNNLLDLIDDEDELFIAPLCRTCFAKALRAGPPIPLTCVA